MEELTDLLAILKEELKAAGLEMHETKTKILSSMNPANILLIDIGDIPSVAAGCVSQISREDAEFRPDITCEAGIQAPIESRMGEIS